VGEVGGRRRRARALQVRGRGHAQAAVVGQAQPDQAGIGQVAHPHRAVHPSFTMSTMRSERFSETLTSGARQGTAARARHVPATEACRRVIRRWPRPSRRPPRPWLPRSRTPAAGAGSPRGRRCLVGERHPARRAHQQLDPEPRLERVEPPADDGGATPSAWAACVRLPRWATATNDSICLNLSMRGRGSPRRPCARGGATAIARRGTPFQFCLKVINQ
jgi:hypothetical protein